MKLGDTPTGAIVNAIRIALAVLGVLAALLAMISAANLLLGEKTASVQANHWYIAAGSLAASLLLFYMAKNFSINSYPYLIPDVLREAQKSKYETDDIDKIIKTLEAHTGFAAFFNRIGFSGVSLATVASAFLVLILGFVAAERGWLPKKEDLSWFLDLSKLLFGAFIGSFASRLPISQEASKKTETKEQGQNPKPPAPANPPKPQPQTPTPPATDSAPPV